MNVDGLKGTLMIFIAIALMGYAVYVGHYEVILIFLVFYIVALVLNRLKKKND